MRSVALSPGAPPAHLWSLYVILPSISWRVIHWLGIMSTAGMSSLGVSRCRRRPTPIRQISGSGLGCTPTAHTKKQIQSQLLLSLHSWKMVSSRKAPKAMIKLQYSQSLFKFHIQPSSKTSFQCVILYGDNIYLSCSYVILYIT